MILHFVYSVPPAPGLAGALRRRARRAGQRLGLPISAVGDRVEVDTAAWPPRAPATITAHVREVLREFGEVRLYHLDERLTIPGGADHVLIGHPLPGVPSAVWNSSFDRGTFGARVALCPLSYGLPEVVAPLDPYVERADALFGIMGPFWRDTWESGPFPHWCRKLTAFDMAVDVDRFPRIKRGFNPPGSRTFLYIGWRGPAKGTHLLSELFRRAPGHRCVAIGDGPPVAHVENRPAMALTPAAVARLAQECDFLVTMGVSDANPTTILESMAWGFPVACTPQSGYHDVPEILTLSPDDWEANLRLLDRLQWAPERELLDRADAARRLVETRYTWDRFTGRLRDRLTAVLRARGLPGPHPLRGDAPEAARA